MIGRGVGLSGSPTPRLITSRPAAMAAFFFLSISANKYGGSFRSRSDLTNGVDIVAVVLHHVAPYGRGLASRGPIRAVRRRSRLATARSGGHRLLGDVVVGVDVLDVV